MVFSTISLLCSIVVVLNIKITDKNDMVKSRNSDVSTLVPVTTGDMYYTDEE